MPVEVAHSARRMTLAAAFGIGAFVLLAVLLFVSVLLFSKPTGTIRRTALSAGCQPFVPASSACPRS